MSAIGDACASWHCLARYSRVEEIHRAPEMKFIGESVPDRQEEHVARDSALVNSKRLDTASLRQARRNSAIALHLAGHCAAAIGRSLGVTREAVRQWLSAYRNGGLPALVARARVGAPPKLSRAERACLPGLLSAGPREYGYPFDEWTAKRIASFIKQRYGVTYHPAHIGRLMRQLGVHWKSGRPVANVPRHQATFGDWAPAPPRLPILLWGGVLPSRGRLPPASSHAAV